jgi:hypothetical protein
MRKALGAPPSAANEEATKGYVDGAVVTLTAATYTANNRDIILANCAGNSVTVTVPNSAGAQVTVKRVDSSTTNTLTVVASSGTIDGDANATIIGKETSAVFVGDGTNVQVEAVSVAQYSQATPAPTASTVMSRDSNGRSQVATPSGSSDISTKGYVDGLFSALPTGVAALITNWDTALSIVSTPYVSAPSATGAPTLIWYYQGTCFSPDGGGTYIQTVTAYSRLSAAGMFQRYYTAGAWQAWVMIGGPPTLLAATSFPTTPATAAWTECSLASIVQQGCLDRTSVANYGLLLPLAGWYDFFLSVAWPGNATGRRIVGVGPQGGTSAIATDYDNRTAAGAAGMNQNVHIGPLYVSALTNMTMWIYQDSGSALVPAVLQMTAQPVSA